MRWLFFVFSAIGFAIAFRTHSIGLAAFCLLLALGLLLAGVVALASHRIESRSRHEGQMLSAEEIRLLREQAERRRKAGAGAAAVATAGMAGSDNPGSDGGAAN